MLPSLPRTFGFIVFSFPLLVTHLLLCCILLPYHQFRVVTAPFHRVEFADFWLADQLNSLGMVLMDLEYMICYYSMDITWANPYQEMDTRGMGDMTVCAVWGGLFTVWSGVV